MLTFYNHANSLYHPHPGMDSRMQKHTSLSEPSTPIQQLNPSPPAVEENELIRQHSAPEDEQQEAFLPEEDGDQSDDEAERIRDMEIKKVLLRENLAHQSNLKMVVGTGFSMDVTEFFHFDKNKVAPASTVDNIFADISGSRLAWLILLYSVTSGAMIPGWIMNIKANKLLRISWRFFMQTFMVIPFVLYEYRTCDEDTRKKYNLKHIFQPDHIIKPFISSLATSMWFTVILQGFEWTSVSHSIVMGSLSNFFLSIGRSLRRSSHDLELGGQMLVLLGVFLVLVDSFKFLPDYLSPRDFAVVNTFYFGRKWWERVFFDLCSFSMSFGLSEFSKFTADLKNYYPPFLSMLLVNIFNCIHMAFSCYFVNGTSFDFDSFFGIWSLFSQLHFSGFMYMAIILSLGQIISLVMITRLFPDPIIPALVMTLEPFIASFILDLTDVQRLPGTFSIIAYLFMVPGLCLILVGQCLYQRISTRKQEDEKRAIALMNDLRELQSKEENRNARMKSRQARVGRKDYSGFDNKSKNSSI